MQTVSVENLIRNWNNYRDGTEVTVHSSARLWEFLASKRHPSQRQLNQENLRVIEASLAADGFKKECSSDSVLVEAESKLVISWQHRTEVFRKAPPDIEVRVLFGAALASMAKTPKSWTKAESANLAMSSELLDGERVGPNDIAIASQCELIVFSRVRSTTDAHVENCRKWMSEVRIARMLPFSTAHHGHALRPCGVRACTAMAISRYGEKMERIHGMIKDEDKIPTIAGFFSLLDRWAKSTQFADHRRYGAACLRGFSSWVSGHPVKSWRVSSSEGIGHVDESDELTRNDWRRWKNLQRKNGSR